MPIGDILPEIAVVLSAVAILLFASFAPQRLQWIGAPLALVGLAAAAALCVAQFGETRLTFSQSWALDAASQWGRLLILGATAFTTLLAPGWFAEDRRHGEYYAMLLFSALGAMAMAGAADLLQLVMGALLSSASGYVLAAYHRDWALSVEAGMKFFLIGALANTAMVVGVVLTFGMLGSTGFAGMGGALAGGQGSPVLLVGAVLVILGLAYKLGAAPMHAWMPDVAEGAPVPSTAFLTVVPKVGAAIAFARFVSLFPEGSVAIRPLVAALALITMTLGNLAALWQEDLRRMLGWSSVSQSGYALMAVAVVGLSPHAVPALILFLFGYAASNLTAFAAVAHLRGRTARADYDGLATTRPWVAGTIILALLSLVGIPPSIGFVGKLELFLATVDGGYSWLAAAAVINTVASLFYYLRFIAPMMFAPPTRPVATLGLPTGVAVAIGSGAILILAMLAEGLLTPLMRSGFLPLG
ncbi:NADH-quinone oxidoreductase subunit N [Consotaella salsifontis]|uniref:NADH-quinone oxidoreductase subunit N n=1 Tax=Consotaella salsifontis TaxID=1365950 RepID=A0A1T4RMA2_9HYPH|nr:NADH-quinone oxidoreductase subunit N [Consotaella salsifontis]SKA17073.1 NADH dehydrogenase subunit N [Consotaella salsifontis]